MFGLQRQSPRSWYRERIREELRERQTANTLWQKLSEASDVFFSISRAHHDGYPVRKLPAFVSRQFRYMHTCWQSTLHVGLSIERPLCSARPLNMTWYVRWSIPAETTSLRKSLSVIRSGIIGVHLPEEGRIDQHQTPERGSRLVTLNNSA
jgi:hypothetical protein